MFPTVYVGIDLGGARGRTTAVATLHTTSDGVAVVAAGARAKNGRWSDEELWSVLAAQPSDAVIAVGAPLTQPACQRCVRPVCPGAALCDDEAVVWLRTEGQRLVEGQSATAETADGTVASAPMRHRVPLVPYLHRAADVLLTYGHRSVPTESLAAATGAVASRAHQLRLRLAGIGIHLGERLVEVSVTASLTAWFGSQRARSARHGSDAWHQRARMLDEFSDLGFTAKSRFSREDALARVHVFDAVVAAYTAYKGRTEGWWTPDRDGPWRADGWIVAPPIGSPVKPK